MNGPIRPRLQVDNFRHALSLVGAPRRDAFKSHHKVQLGPGFWATDLDLVLVRKAPAGVVAILDCKQPGEPLSFAEVVAYNDLLAVSAIYIVEVRDPTTGPFTILRYREGDWHPSPPAVTLEQIEVCPTGALEPDPALRLIWHVFTGRRMWENGGNHPTQALGHML